MGDDAVSNAPHKKIIKTSMVIWLGAVLVILIVEGVLIYNWQHKKVTSLQQQVKTLNIQLQYVQGQQNKLEKQLK